MSSPPVPEGWQARWDHESNQWYYYHSFSGVSQWLHPGIGQNAPPSHYVPNEQSRGFMGKATTGIAAGGLFEQGWSEFKKHHEHHDHKFEVPGVGAMTGLLGMAGAGAKLFGGKRRSPSPPPQTQPPTYTPLPVPVPVSVPIHAPAPHYSPPPSTAPVSYPASHYSPPPPTVPVSYPSPPPTQFMGVTTTVAVSGKPPLIIHAAVFAGADVTRKLQALVTPDQSIIMKGPDLIGHFGDPWPEAGCYRALVVLYQYGERPMEVYTVLNNARQVEISLQPLITERMKFVNDPQSRIVSLVWGRINVLSAIRAEKLEKEGELETNDLGDCGHFIGTGGMEALPVLVCLYRNDFGGISIGSARCGGTMRLPWNPLAKWN